MSAPSKVDSSNPTTQVKWDPEKTKKNLKDNAHKVVTATEPVLVAAVQMTGAVLKVTPGVAPFAPIIDASTQFVAPVVIHASAEASVKPASDASIDKSVDAAVASNEKSAQSW